MPVGQSVLAIIPARGGSKGLPGKNILPLAGKPLIAWSIETARACPEIDRLILSSDDAEIIATAQAWGCEVPFIRPPHLANDTASTLAVLLHALESLPERYEWLVLLQPTSPLRWAADISACLEICRREAAPACVTVTATKTPLWSYFLEADGRMVPILGRDNTRVGRQQLPAAYQLNGAVYVARCDWFQQQQTFVHAETRAHVMPPERSVDIDTAFDLRWAEFLWHSSHPESAPSAHPPPPYSPEAGGSGR
ncbi:MAG: acylneuraminate cytidylyltransferase family protein [Magnetococcales bacterium]|nr:acylneuraminate cytidylyltransferase family protein [Magnetococcales bacterium]